MKNKTFAALSVLLLLGTIPLFRTKPPVAAAQAQSLPDLSKVSLKSCITLPAELPDYKPDRGFSYVIKPRIPLPPNPASKIQVTFHPAAWDARGRAAGTFFKRLSDENMISVDVAVCPTEAETQALIDEARETQSGSVPEGTYSKRAIGQHVYSDTPRNGKFMCCHTIIAQDGRAKVMVTEMTKTLNVNGRPVPTEMPAKDALLCEDIALRVLDRLTFLGHTSQPANSASKEAQRQVLDWIAAHPDIATSKP